MTISAVILAGGKSLRMGRDKAWLEYKRQPLLCHQTETVLRLDPAEMFIAGGSNPQFARLGWPILIDNFPGQGPLAGIEKALAVMRSPLLLVLAVDMPHMTAAVLRRLAGHCSDRTGVVPRLGDRVEPLAAFYPKAAHRPLRTSLGEGLNSAVGFAQLCVTLGLAEYYDVPPSHEHRFANWNTPADVA